MPGHVDERSSLFRLAFLSAGTRFARPHSRPASEPRSRIRDATLALFLAVVGAYGVKAFLVARRTREIGVRMALGATPRDVMRQMLRESLGLTIAGLALGLLLAAAIARRCGTNDEIAPRALRAPRDRCRMV